MKISFCIEALNVFSELEMMDRQQNNGLINPKLFYAIKKNIDRLLPELKKVPGLFQNLEAHRKYYNDLMIIREKNSKLVKDKKTKQESKIYDEDKIKKEVEKLDIDNETMLKLHKENMDKEIEMEFYKINTNYLPRSTEKTLTFLSNNNLIEI